MGARLEILPESLGGAVEGKLYLTNTFLKLLMTALIWGNTDTVTVAHLSPMVSQNDGPRRALTPPLPDGTKTTPLSHPTSSPQIAFTLLTPLI